MTFDLDQSSRLHLFNFTIERLEQYYSETASREVSPNLNIDEIQNFIRNQAFDKEENPSKAIQHVLDGLDKYSVHTSHPNYFGLFNPRSNYAGILADLITAVYNPQLAAWSHAPFAVEVENYLVQEFGKKFGFGKDNIDGVFTTGGAEANTTAMLCALNFTFENFANDGLLNVSNRPIVYCSAESHHSLVKAAKASGLGLKSVRTISVDQNLMMNIDELAEKISEDLKKGHSPFMIVGTAGTTGTGAIDNLEALSALAKQFNVWFHVDAAFGGGAILSRHSSSMLKGIEYANSITFDAHKWMSVPMGASLFLTTEKTILAKTYRVTTEYMPKEANKLEIIDPFTHSVQWSRRFSGLKLYLSLLIFGWKGYEETIDHHMAMSKFLREALLKEGWKIMNFSNLPIVCFSDPEFENDANFTAWISSQVIESGQAWLSTYPVHQKPTLRACITNYATQERHIKELVKLLGEKRREYTNRDDLCSPKK